MGYTEPDQYGDCKFVTLLAEDVLDIGRALRAWPLPLLHDMREGWILLLSAGMPAAAADWSNVTTLEFFRGNGPTAQQRDMRPQQILAAMNCSP